MGIHFTPAQEKVLKARNHNVLVSAAAGSGKTAVLVERIVRLISEGEHPLDIDRLLVVTFTRAAAAQMRERIGDAIAQRLVDEPDNVHLQRQETLLYNAKITTMDSFFTFILRNNFSDIDIDPGYRQMDETEASLMMHDTLDQYLEKKFLEADPKFLSCVAYWDPVGDGGEVIKWVEALYRQSVSHPSPRSWLLQRKKDYHVESVSDICRTPWFTSILKEAGERLSVICDLYDRMLHLSSVPGGPHPYMELLEEERDGFYCIREEMEGNLREMERIVSGGTESAQSQMEEKLFRAVEGVLEALNRCDNISFARLPSVSAKKYPDVDKNQTDIVKKFRDDVKKKVKGVAGVLDGQKLTDVAEVMKRAELPTATLIDLTLEFMEAWRETKRQANVIDFIDLEHFALEILTKENEDGSFSPRRAAMSYRQHYDEILIDEYQDSNDVQELLLSIISREEDGKYNRFMVGDVKQSIYKFRLARPEIFMDKYARYQPDDREMERIDLDSNFRSRHQVLDSVNSIFMSAMRREIGGVEYDEQVSLKCGASYPEGTEGDGEEAYKTEFLVLDESTEETEPIDNGDGSSAFEESELAAMNARRKQIVAISGKIKELVGTLPVLAGSDGTTRPCRYGDIVLLLRSSRGWNEEIKEIFEQQGIPVYVDSKTGYFSAQEIRNVLQLMKILDNPRQDIPLYNVLRGYWGRFSDEEISAIRAIAVSEIDKSPKEIGLYEAVQWTAAKERTSLCEKCAQFLDFIARWRNKLTYMPVHELLTNLLDHTGYMDYCTALPGGEQRLANLKMLENQSVQFDKMGISGLFLFLRYIEQMHHREVDYGEANTLDENADVVRVMTIHKSKGLEFPVCIVAGLEKRYSYLNHDTKGAMIIDNDWGLGVDFYSEELRSRFSTLRKEAIAGKIRRDSLGEELRVLYVAMTRAKEKLILVGSLKDARKKFAIWADSLPVEKNSSHLPVTSIGDTTNYLELISKSISYQNEERTKELFDIKILSTRELELQDLREQADIAIRRQKLDESVQEENGSLPDAEFEEKLKVLFSRKYASENLQGLYTKTSVSELKHASMNLEDPDMGGDSLENRSEFRATDYGTAVHRLLALFPYEGTNTYSFAPCKNICDLSARELAAWMESLSADGQIPLSYLEGIHPGVLRPFLQSDICKRMNAASSANMLYREQPFVLGVPANRMNPDFPEEEIVLIQGIIDAFFEEDGELVVVDYKTDRVTHPQTLIDRYEVQLNNYASALAQITGKRVKEKIIFSFALKREIIV